MLSYPSRINAADTSFFRLPLELRENIYVHHLITSFRPTPWMIYKHTYTDTSPPTTPFIGVNKQFYDELFDVLAHQQEFCYRVSSQEATFDGVALSCFRVLKHRRSYNEMKDLTIEIYPPHPDRPIDMVFIWNRVQSFCEDLRTASIIPSLSIHFMEDEIAAWSTKNKPNNTMHVMLLDEQTTSCDVGFILDVFARLTDVRKSTILLPPSLTNHEDLQNFAQGVQDSVSNTHPFTQEMVEMHYELLIEDIDFNQWLIEAATGS